MKVAICSQLYLRELRRILEKCKFEIVQKNPEFAICYGGDGTILYAERKYPSVPKLAIKKERICHRYEVLSDNLEEALERVSNDKYKIVEEMKLIAEYKNYSLTALNEIQVHTIFPTRAIRFSLTVDGKEYENLIGDGVIIATPFGSTGYHLATGGREFKSGIGISFNNLCSRRIPAFVVSEDSVVKTKMNRDTALLLADNNKKYYELKQGDTITIKRSEDKARFIQII